MNPTYFIRSKKIYVIITSIAIIIYAMIISFTFLFEDYEFSYNKKEWVNVFKILRCVEAVLLIVFVLDMLI